MEWFTTNLGTISTIISMMTLLVWVFYAYLLRLTFSRNERPMVLIHQTAPENEESFCLVANLSRQPLHVVTVDLIVHVENHQLTLRINDYKRITNAEETPWASESVMKEGPLKVGEYIVLGDFHAMLEASRSLENQPREREGSRDQGSRDQARQKRQQQKLARRAHKLTLRVSALFSSFDYPIGAIRHFKVIETEQGEIRLDPETPLTKQLQSGRQRREVYQWLKARNDQS